MLSKKILVFAGIILMLFLLGCRQYHKLQEDIPVYSGAKFVKLFRDTSKKKHELWSVEASLDDVSKFYQDEIADKKWKKQMIAPSPDGHGYGLAYSKKDKMLIILVFSGSGQEARTYIDLSITPLSK